MITRDQLAMALGVNAYTITKWQRDGLPVAARGRAGIASRYDLEACRAWKTARDAAAATSGVSVAEASALLKREQAKGYELRNRRLLGELLEARDVERAWAGFIAAARAKLLALPRATAERVCQAASAGPGAVEAVLREQVHAALRELAGEAVSQADTSA